MHATHSTAVPHIDGTQRPQVVGIQHRSPRGEGDEKWSNFDHHCAIDRVAVQAHQGRVALFLQQVEHEGQGVGLELPKDLASMVGHLLLAAAEGKVDTITATVPPGEAREGHSGH